MWWLLQIQQLISDNFVTLLVIVRIHCPSILKIHYRMANTYYLCSPTLIPQCSLYSPDNPAILIRHRVLGKKRRPRCTYSISSILSVELESSFRSNMPHRVNHSTSSRQGPSYTAVPNISHMQTQFSLLQFDILGSQLQSRFLIHRW